MPRHVREQQMLDAAVRTFAERGYRAASMDDIAEAAGVSKPLVYLYLNSKEDLFTACIRRESDALEAAVRAAVEPGAAPDRQLWKGLHGFFSHVADHPYGWAVLHRQARTHGEPFAAEVQLLRDKLVDLVTGLIADAFSRAAVPAADPAPDPDSAADPASGSAPGGLPEEEVAALAHALVGAAESLAIRENGRPGRSAEDATSTLMNFAWAGLDGLMNGRRWSPDR